MKFKSFALQSKSPLKFNPPSTNGSSSTIKSEQFNPVFVSEFDPSKPLFSGTKNKIVVPPKDDEFRLLKRMKNIELPPLHSGNKPLDFELEKAEIGTGEGTLYGLNLRENYGGGGSSEAIMMRHFKNDLETLPEEQGFDEYEDTPVDGFGEAVLAGYDCKEGRGIGKNGKNDVKIVEFKKRCAREALGFGDQPVGKEVRVVKGRDVGLTGRIVEVLDDGVGGRGSLRVDEFAKLGSLEEEKCSMKLKEAKTVESRSDRRREKGDDDRDKSVRRESRRKRDDEVDDVVVKTKHERVMWVRSHIRVRIISKEFKRGKYYSKKGKVVDVIGPGICDILMDDGGGILQAVDQDILETALPHRGGYVLVLFGKHKGVYGKLVEEDTKKETGVVQDADTQEMFEVQLEEIAEYLGDPNYFGY